MICMSMSMNGSVWMWMHACMLYAMFERLNNAKENKIHLFKMFEFELDKLLRLQDFMVE